MSSLAGLVIYVCIIYQYISLNNGLNSRDRYSMNFEWKFYIGSQDLQHVSCDSSTFEQSNVQCKGLTLMQSVEKNNVEKCANACCANPTCALFQISSPSGNCSIGGIISIYDPLYWVSTCTNSGATKLYSRTDSIPDINPNHFIAATKNYDDSSWKTVNIPHDYIVNGTVSSNANPGENRPGTESILVYRNHIKMIGIYLAKNTSWYRKHFSLPQSYQNDTVLFIDFDGIFRDSVVFINGYFLGNHSSGYTSFRYYLDPIKNDLEFGVGSNNVLSVFVDATADEGWWYEGGGIYRNVWFNKINKIYFVPWHIYLPTFVNTVNSDGIHGDGTLIINATINNKYNMDYAINIKFVLINPDGSILKTLIMNNTAIKANSNINVAPSYFATNLQLWGLDNPSLYRVNCTIYDSLNDEIDFVSLKYGYRKVVFDVNNGLYLNEQFVKMKGFCNQDFGGTGVATPGRINRFRIEQLKKIGGNSWRMRFANCNIFKLKCINYYVFHDGIN